MSYGTICPYCRFDEGHASYCPANAKASAAAAGCGQANNTFRPSDFQVSPVRFGPVTDDEVKLLMANEGQVYGPRAKYSHRIRSMLEAFAKSRGLL